MSVRAGVDAVNPKPLIVSEKNSDVVKVLGRVQLEDAVAGPVVHVYDIEPKTFDHWRQHEPRAVHRIGECQEQGKVVGTGAAFVGRKHHERLSRPDP